jgi:hypothetical protein
MAIHAQLRGGSPWHVKPQSGWGWWSVGLAAAFLLFAALVPLAIFSGLETSDFAPAVVIPMGLAGISASAALLVGVVSVIRMKERSILVFLSATLGLVITVFWVGQIVMALWIGAQPHTPPPPPPG